MNLADRSQAYRLILGQVGVSLLAALLLQTMGQVVAWSGLLGGMIATLTSALFAARVFVSYRAQEPEKLLGRFFGAELQKFILTGLLFAGVIIWFEPLSMAALFGVYLLVQIVPVIVVHYFS